MPPGFLPFPLVLPSPASWERGETRGSPLPRSGRGLKTATFNIPTPTPLEKQKPHRVSIPIVTHFYYLESGQPDGDNHYTQLLYHIQQLVRNTPLHTTRPEPNACCVPFHCLPTFSQKARYANPTSRRSEIEGWIAGIRAVRAWLNTAGRSEPLLLCVGDGRGDTEALGQLDLPNTVCCVRTRKDSRGCDLPSEATSGRGRPRV
jgi:hypothetical protein